jgi:hypothetical protein
MKRYLHSAMLALAFGAVAACGGDKKDEAPAGGGGTGGGDKAASAGAPAGGGAKYDASKSTASVSGSVKWGGAPVQQAMITPSGDKFCVDKHDGKQFPDDKTMVGAGGALPNCFVWAVNGPHKSLTGYSPTEGFVLDQQDCVYVPHVFGVMTGQKFTVKNDDATTHNVHVKARTNKPINKPQSAGAADVFTFDKREQAIPIGCDIHSWMSAFCFVLDHPFFAVTDSSGKFEIKGLPAGEYTFRVWHETFLADRPEFTSEFKLTVKDGEAHTAPEVVLK